LLFATPIDQILRAFAFDSSGIDRSAFYVTVFAQPLYIPHPSVYYNFGHRLGTSWEANDVQVVEKLVNAIQAQGLPFLERIQQPRDLAEFIRERMHLYRGRRPNPHDLEALAYSCILADDSTAGQVLEDLFNQLDPTVEWEVEIGARATKVAEAMARSPLAARAMLLQWEQETVQALGLEQFRTASHQH
jgi:hypothetical protein